MKQISLGDIERMDGLVNIEDLRTVVDTSKSIIDDMVKDGFEKGEITTYLWFCIDQQRMPPGTEGRTEAECFNKRERSR